ncbi:MAG: hypothetical protein U1E77_03460 [Inhella sp.]
MSALQASLQEQLEAQREAEWRRQGVPESDVLLSRRCGMDAADIGVLRRHSQQGWLIVVRCPKVTARAHHGRFAPKPISEKAKSGDSGLVVTAGGRILVSDYDLMCVCARSAQGWQRLPISAANGKSRGAYSEAARNFLVQLNTQLVSKFQHGCQDDYASASNPGLKPADHFMAFAAGQAHYLSDPGSCEAFYRQQGLDWRYAGGSYIGPTA